MRDIDVIRTQAGKFIKAFRRQDGVSLIVVVAALLVLGASFLAGMRYLAPGAGLARQNSISGTALHSLQPAIWAFVGQNYHLPCPAPTVDGAAAASCSGAVATGFLPWSTLGIPKSLAQDSWGQMLGYAVTAGLTQSNTPYRSQTVTSLNALDHVAVSSSASPLAYALLSYGPDGGGYNNAGTLTTFATTAGITAGANEQTNISVISGGGGTFSAGFSPTSVTYRTASAVSGAGAVGGQWLVFENSTSICRHVSGAGSSYCTGTTTTNPNPQNCIGGACSFKDGQLATSAASPGNPNGISSNAVLLSNLPMSVLVLGSSSASPTDDQAPSLTSGSQACDWQPSPFLLTTGTLRAYFEFSTAGMAAGDGFTMAFLPGATSRTNGTPCGGTPGGQGMVNGSGNVNQGSYLGFEEITDGGLQGTAKASAAVSSSTSNNKVTSVTVGSTGSGYLWIPPVEITGAGSGATASVSAAQIAGITATYPGAGYIAPPGTSAAPPVTIAPAGGAGYLSAPTVLIEPAASTGCTAGCSDATGTATIANKQVTALTITSPGSGYKRAPAITLTGSTASGCATGCADAIGASSTINGSTGAVTGLYISQDSCTQTGSCGAAIVTAMDVRSVVLDSGGSGYNTSAWTPQSGGTGYISTPSVFIEGIATGNSGGQKATATATVSNGSVSAVTITNPGQNYVSNVEVVIAGGGIAYATIGNIQGDGTVSDVQLQDRGANYPPNFFVLFLLPPPLNCSFPSVCFPAVALANTDNNGFITGVSILFGGLGYSSAYDKGNWAPVTDATHVPATVTATVTNGSITALGPSGGVSPVTVTVVPATGEPSTPTAATVTATVVNGTVTGLTLTSYGTGYTLVPTISISNPNSCSSGCATATAHVASMGVDTVGPNASKGGYSGSFTAIPSIGIDPPSSACTSNCSAAMAAANVKVTGITVANAGTGYTSVGVSLPPPIVLPKFGIEFRTYHTPTDSYYSDYGYHDDWGFFGSSTAASYSPGVIGSALTALTSAQATANPTYTTTSPTLYPLPQASPATQSFAGNIRHDDSSGCAGSNCMPEYMAALIVDALHHDVTYHYSAYTAGNTDPGTDNTAYTVSSSCDSASTAGSNVAMHNGGFIAGGASTGGALASKSAPKAGGCSYATSGTTNILTTDGPLTDTQNGTSVKYHPVRVEVRRYCDPSCSSCGNKGTSTATYMQVAAYLDCDSAALGGQSCSDTTQNLLVPGTKVFSVAVINGGSNYTSAPTVSISGGGGSGATATATIANGKVSGVTVTAPGSGFTSVPTVSFSGGGANVVSATATAQISGLPLPATYTGGHVYAVNYCTVDPGVTNWTSSQMGLSSLDSILAGFTVGGGVATRGVLIRNLQIGTYN